MRHFSDRNDMQHFSIGATARMTQIPAHTLRKWESRHGIAVPVRTNTGRRVYTEEQLELLRLIKLLTANGHALSQLADQEIDALRALAALHQSEPQRTKVRSLTLIGPSVSRLLHGNPMIESRYGGEAAEWLRESGKVGTDAVVIESPTLGDDIVEFAQEIRQRVPLVIVVYAFAARAKLSRLGDAGITAIQGPANDQDVLVRLEGVDDAPREAKESPRRFSTMELARIARLNPRLQCECPNHIAKLLMDISAFERYSRECAGSSPADTALHRQLGDISAAARRLFEDALIAVAEADGLQISLRD
ncbi:MAG: MerR family transcriptional regulator [Gammaproteobacteria bacterium]|nr:MerR family transcriptional regulator [Gammaproteobacteria bacterium]